MRGLLTNAIVLCALGSQACSPTPTPVVSAPAPSAASAPAPPLTAAASSKAENCSADEPYQPTLASSGRAPQLPDVPAIPPLPTKIGDAYTVFGAMHALRSRFGSSEVTHGEITITGYIVDENMQRAPPCAIHKSGKADPDGCIAPTPSFTVADAKGSSSGIKVLGWARNFAISFDANAAYAKGKPSQPVRDDVFAVDLPYPLPAVGAKVKVTGNYGTSYTRSSTGITTDPVNGILTYGRMETVEPAPHAAKLGR